MKSSPATTYSAPEVICLGVAEELTLGQINMAYPDGCNCSKGCAEEEDLGC